MANYFFHQCIGDEYLADDDGIDVPDLKTIRSGAVTRGRQ